MKPLKIRTWLAFLPMTLAIPVFGSTLTGRWKLDAAASSSIKPWDVEILSISVEGQKVSFDRELSWDTDRRYKDHTDCVTDGKTVTPNAVEYWVDTWYNNCYIGADHSKRVSASWLENGKKLSTTTDLRLEAQQGEIPVTIEDEYEVSADGSTLSVTERRSTRDQVLHFTFKRE